MKKPLPEHFCNAPKGYCSYHSIKTIGESKLSLRIKLKGQLQQRDDTILAFSFVETWTNFKYLHVDIKVVFKSNENQVSI